MQHTHTHNHHTPHMRFVCKIGKSQFYKQIGAYMHIPHAYCVQSTCTSFMRRQCLALDYIGAYNFKSLTRRVSTVTNQKRKCSEETIWFWIEKETKSFQERIQYTTRSMCVLCICCYVSMCTLYSIEATTFQVARSIFIF